MKKIIQILILCTFMFLLSSDNFENKQTIQLEPNKIYYPTLVINQEPDQSLKEQRLETRVREHNYTPTYLQIAQRVYQSPEEFGIDPFVYDNFFSDNILSDTERKILYLNYYTESPKEFVCSATLYGDDSNARAELLTYGLWIRQQMERGWVLIGSGEYGYHPEIESQLRVFIEKYYNYKDSSDILLSKQKSPVYFFFADGGLARTKRDSRNQPIPVTYEELNPRQKRIYYITSMGTDRMQKEVFTTIEEQQKLGPTLALQSGKYIGIVSAKSVNDFGRRFLLFLPNGANGKLNFIGVVIVGGEAKRDDWLGIGSPTSDYFKVFPLSVRKTNGQQWGLDIPTSIYEYIKGCDVTDEDFCFGPATDIIVVDPD